MPKTIHRLDSLESRLESVIRQDCCYKTRRGSGVRGDVLVGAGFMKKDGVGKNSPRHGRVSHYSLIYVLRGRGEYRDGSGGFYELRPGSVFQRFPQQTHELEIDPASRWVECYVALDTTAQEAFERYGIPDRSRPVFYPGMHWHLVQRVDRLVHSFHHLTDSAMPALAGEIIQIVTAFYEAVRASGKDSAEIELVERAKMILAGHLGSRETIPRLLSTLPRGYEQLRKQFRTVTGMTPTGYRIRCRVDAARALLMDRTLSVKDIADRLGYPNPYAFSSQFRQWTGQSPLRYRVEK